VDGIAFLAHTKEDSKCVSAATLQQSLEPPSIQIRLASNKTPIDQIVDELEKFLGIVEEYARTGTVKSWI
jgi:hypothetical protein